jgi:uncharacterized membrane protein
MSGTGVIGRLAHRDEDGERGAILLIAAASLTLLVFAAALAIDIGGRAEEQTNNQRIADLAALDAVRVLPTDPSAEGLLSAARNGYATLNTPTIISTPGTWAAGVFTPTTTSPNAVKVVVTSVYHDFFGGGSPTLTGTAIAQDDAEAQFQIGSTLISITALNSLLAPFGSGLTLTAVGYNGLLGGNVTLGALATQLGFGALSPTQILSSQVTVAQLFTAAANLLNNSGGSSGNLAVLGSMMASGTFNSNDQVTLGGILGTASVQNGNGSALGTSVNLLSLLSGGLELANGEAGVALPLAVTIPGVVSSTANITGIVPAKRSGRGPVGSSQTQNVSNNQVTIALNVVMNVSAPLPLGLGGVIQVTLPMTILLGKAEGSLTAIDCSGLTPTDIKIATTFDNLNIGVGNTAKVTALAGTVTGTLSGSISVPSNAVPTTTVNDPANFTPGGGTAVPVNSNLGAPNANLTASGAFSSAAPVIDAAVNTVVAAALPALGTAAGGLLGINVGNADLLGLYASCSVPHLVQ